MPDQPAPCATVEAVREDLARRAEFGLAKYGQTVADNPADLRAWLQHAYEETLDKAVYLRRAMAEMDAKAIGGATPASRSCEAAMPDNPTPARSRSRFARLWPDGSMSVEPAGIDFFQARERLRNEGDDDEVELLEVEITVIRSHGKPKLHVVTEHSATCPCCGETVFVEVPTDGA